MDGEVRQLSACGHWGLGEEMAHARSVGSIQMDTLWEFRQCIQQLSHIGGGPHYPDPKRFGCILPLILIVQIHESL